MKAIIVLAHGSRAVEANQVLYDILDMVREQVGPAPVKPAFMDHCRPDLETAVQELVNQGIKSVIVVPLFLFRGIHVQKDIPGDIQLLRDKYGIDIVCARNLGSDRRIAGIVVDRIMEVS